MTRFPETPRFRALAASIVLLGALAGCEAFQPGFAEFGGERMRDPRDLAAQHDTIVRQRLETLLPEIMREVGADCWLLFTDRRGGDSLVTALTLSSTTFEGDGALLLCSDATGTTRFAVGHGFDANEALYEVVEPTSASPLELLLRERLVAADPARIAIDDSPSFPPADRLSASRRRWIEEHLPAELVARMESSQDIVERFLATQLPVEAALFAESVRITTDILERALSDQVVFAAGTSVLDLEWAVRELAAQIPVELAFPPRAVVHRRGATLEEERSMRLDLLLQPGDLVFLSAGVRHLGYSNHVGRWAYLLHTGEREAPLWVNEALAGLADGAEEIVATLRAGEPIDEVLGGADGALTGWLDPHVAIDRVGRLAEGTLRASSGSVASAWTPGFQLAADTAISLTIDASVRSPEAGGRAWPIRFLDTALVTASGATFVVSPQRTPLLID